MTPANVVLSPEVIINNAFGFGELVETEESREILDFMKSVAEALRQGVTLEVSVRAAVKSFPTAARFYRIDFKTIERTFGLKKKYLFPKEKDPLRFTFINKETCRGFEFSPTRQQIPDFTKLLETLYQGAAPPQLARLIPKSMHGLLKNLKSNGFLTSVREADNFLNTGRGGIKRLQHASLIFQSESTRILVDPVFYSHYDPRNLQSPIMPFHLYGKIDAILISHSHEDHFDLPSLMGFPKDVPIFVPRVSRASILSRDCEAILKRVGFQNVRAVDWYSKAIKIGDFEISPLPFYGEQPTRRFKPKHRECWNFGNTYVVKHKNFTAWILVDSGADARGDMAQVARFVRKKFGRIDFLFSNLREFVITSPLHSTGGSYWLSLPTKQIKIFHKMLGHITTLGPTGVAEVAKITGAQFFFPYAHLWHTPGRIAASTDETENYRQLRKKMRDLRCVTVPKSWNVGDFINASSRRLIRFKP